jgi:hypothetical protein
MAVAPRLGETVAVLLELPVMLGVSWVLARAIARRCRLGGAAAPRLLMGGLAFLLLIAAEFALGVLLTDTPPARIVAGWGTTSGAAGLAAQIAFALFPFLERRLGTTFPSDGDRARD